MPSKPLRPCSHPGCPALVRDGSRCTGHQRKDWKAETKVRLSTTTGRQDKAFYDSALWKKVRAGILRTEPWCRECLAIQRVTLATMVDHIKRIRDGGAKLDPANLQPLCEACHARKRWEESQVGRQG